MSRRPVLDSRTRTLYRIRSSSIVEVVCHRVLDHHEQYLVQWHNPQEEPLREGIAVYSWHPLKELTAALDHVQTYIENLNKSRVRSGPKWLDIPALSSNRKRKSPDIDSLDARDTPLGILTHASSVVSVDTVDNVVVYNGTLEKKAGWIVAKKSESEPKATHGNDLPSPRMIEEAFNCHTTQAERAIRRLFEVKLKSIPNVSLVNQVDTSTPSLNFTFVKDYVLGANVERADDAILEGCSKPCRPNMGGHCGCELPTACACLEFAAVNVDALKNEPDKYREYMSLTKSGVVVDHQGLPKRFPYHKARPDSGVPQTLVEFYRESRHPIYECNKRCACGPGCKSRCVQKGRRVPLTLFKTANRGWGIYCDEELVPGEFIDTYLGEVITQEETERRQEKAGRSKESYLYTLDKFLDDDPDLTDDNCYVVDGQYKGGITRFINHSCEPNCRQYTVSYNKNDLKVYDLAFFAYEYIPARTELTFDYMDNDEEEEEDVFRRRETALRDPRNADKTRCNCGAKKCRGYLWTRLNEDGEYEV